MCILPEASRAMVLCLYLAAHDLDIRIDRILIGGLTVKNRWEKVGRKVGKDQTEIIYIVFSTSRTIAM